MSRWAVLATWILPPLGMSIAYSVLAWSSNTDAAGKAAMALGFGFVCVLWVVFRILVDRTALARAVASNDTQRILALTERKLATKRGDARAPFLVYRALAYESRGEHTAALAALDEARPSEAPLQALGSAIRMLSLVETGDVTAARREHDEQLAPRMAKLDARLHAMPHLHANLARGRLLLAEGKRDEAHMQLKRVVDDVRAGSALRDRARTLIAR